jgi:pilus assembly protein FimV
MDLSSLNPPVADTQAELDAFGGLDASPDFSPEGTLVISASSGLMPSGEADFSFDAAPLDKLAPPKEVASVPEPVAAAEEALSAPVSAPRAFDEQPVSPDASETGLLMEEAPELVNTVVNPLAGNAEDMDFDVKLSDSVFLGQPMTSEFDIGSINLDLAAEPVAEAAPAPVADLPEPKAAPAAEVHDAQWEEVNTKLDLAKAYEEMGDLEGARELLQEVLGEGSADLVAEAETILGRLGG